MFKDAYWFFVLPMQNLRIISSFHIIFSPPRLHAHPQLLRFSIQWKKWQKVLSNIQTKRAHTSLREFLSELKYIPPDNCLWTSHSLPSVTKFEGLFVDIPLLTKCYQVRRIVCGHPTPYQVLPSSKDCLWTSHSLESVTKFEGLFVDIPLLTKCYQVRRIACGHPTPYQVLPSSKDCLWTSHSLESVTKFEGPVAVWLVEFS